MRVAFSGNVEEARALLGKAQQELFRLKQRMTLRGDAQGSFHMQLSPLASVSMQVLPNGIEQIFIDVRPVPVLVGEERPTVVGEIPSPYFEFVTSGKPVVKQTISQGNLTGSVYKSAVVSVEFDNKVVRTSILGGARQQNTASVSRLARGSQVNLADEPATVLSTPEYIGTPPVRRRTEQYGEYKKILYESWAPNHPFTGVFYRVFNTGGNGMGVYDARGSLDVHNMRDVGFDVPWADSEDVKPMRNAFIQNNVDWPRASGKQIVKSQWGDREFALYFDAFDQVSVFPTSAIEPLHQDPYEQNVPVDHVLTQKIPLPAWAFKKSMMFRDFFNISGGSIGDVEFPELDWKMHPDGTKACAVVVERYAAMFDAAYFTIDPGSVPPTQQKFDDYCNNHNGFQFRWPAYVEPDNLPQRYYIAPGLLEINLNIAIVGPDTKNFTFGITVTELRRPTTSAYCTMLAGYVWYDIEAEPEEGATSKTYMADRGDLLILDIERFYQPNIGNRGSFLSLKNATKSTELIAFSGGNVCDYDFTTMSFAIIMENTETVNRMLQPRPQNTNGKPQNFAYTVVHQATAIYTFGKFKTLLFPDTLPQIWRDKFSADILFNPRLEVSRPGSDWTFMPLNDARDWTDPELANLRLHYALQFGWKSYNPDNPELPIPNEIMNWWAWGMNAYFPATNMLDCAAPRFGWYVYADEIMNRLQVSPWSTFFVHPSGTWAFYDQHRIYNPYGMYGPIQSHDALAPALNELQLEHIIHDFVHLETKDGSFDTSFIALYNEAVRAGNQSGTLTESFELVSKVDLRVSFGKEVYDDGTGVQLLQLRCNWQGYTFFYFETGYQGGPSINHYYTDAGGLMDLTLGGTFYGSPGYGGPYTQPASSFPVHFSTCVMVTNNNG